MKRIVTVAGERFGLLVAIRRGEDYVFPNGKKAAERWIYRCDCGAEVLDRPAQVRYQDRTGIASCKDCFMKWKEAGGGYTPSNRNPPKPRAPGRNVGDLNETRDLVRPILDALNKLDGVKVMRNAVGLVIPFARRGAAPFKAGLGAGSADIVGIVSGRFFALEVKIPGGVISEDQEVWLVEIRQLGGYAAVVTSVEEAIGAVALCRAGLSGEPQTAGRPPTSSTQVT